MAVTPVRERGYANPDLLVDTQWLAEHLDDDALRIIDTRSAEAYAAGHIPGAVNLAAHGAIPRAANGDMGAPEDFDRLARSLGVNADSTVIIYDAPSAAMGMAAWAFAYFGHSNVRVLDGGFAKWSAEGHPTSIEPAGYPAGDFEAQVVEAVYCSLDHARSVHGTPGTVFWDVRAPGEYDGSDARNNTRPGHVAGAVHLEWTELLDPETKTFRPADELHALLGSRGITPESEINCY